MQSFIESAESLRILVRALICNISAPSKPHAEKFPAYGGTIISFISNSLAIRLDIKGPAPPKASSFNSRGSIPCSIVISLIASAMLALLIFSIPFAVSRASRLSFSPTDWRAFSDKDLSSCKPDASLPSPNIPK